MTQKELYKKVQLLKAGQIVQINGDCFRAHRISDRHITNPCDYCDLDSICRGDVAIVCDAMDDISRRRWYLELAHD